MTQRIEGRELGNSIMTVAAPCGRVDPFRVADTSLVSETTGQRFTLSYAPSPPLDVRSAMREPARGERIQQWILGGGALGLTAAGVMLYAALRIPTSIFYSRLQASPESVGLSYGDLLTGST